MRIMKTPDRPTEAIEPIVLIPKAMSVRLTIRSDEAARRKIADTDGTHAARAPARRKQPPDLTGLRCVAWVSTALHHLVRTEEDIRPRP